MMSKSGTQSNGFSLEKELEKVKVFGSLLASLSSSNKSREDASSSIISHSPESSSNVTSGNHPGCGADPSNAVRPYLEESSLPGSTEPEPVLPDIPRMGASTGEMMSFANSLFQKFEKTMGTAPIDNPRVPLALLPEYIETVRSEDGIAYDACESAVSGFRDIIDLVSDTFRDLDSLNDTIQQQASRYQSLADLLRQAADGNLMQPHSVAEGSNLHTDKLDSEESISKDGSTPQPPEIYNNSTAQALDRHTLLPISNGAPMEIRSNPASLSHTSYVPIEAQDNPSFTDDNANEHTSSTKVPSSHDAGSSLVPVFMSKELVRRLRNNETYINGMVTQILSDLATLADDRSEQVQVQNLLGLALLYRYELKHNAEDLDKAATITSYALTCEEANPLSSLFVRNWLYAQRLMAWKEGDVENLSYAIDMGSTTLSQQLFYPKRLQMNRLLATELSESLLERYLCLGNVEDLTLAISHLKSVSFNLNEPSDSTAMSFVAGHLYLQRYRRRGNMQDLDNALLFARSMSGMHNFANAESTIVPDLDASASSHLLALVTVERFYVLSNMDDLNEAITCGQRAIQALVHHHPFHAIYGGNYAAMLLIRFEVLEKMEDLHLAIQEARAAIDAIMHEAYPHFPPQLILGHALAELGERNEYLPDLDEALHIARVARKNYAGPSYLQSQVEHCVSKIAACRFQVTADIEDLQMAIHHARSALEHVSEDDRSRAELALYLGRLLIMCQTVGHETDDSSWEESAALFSSVALSNVGPASVRLESAVEWSNAARPWGTETALEGMETALRILPEVAWIGHHMPVRYAALLIHAMNIPTQAAMLAIEHGDLLAALQHLESGRNILWTQSLQLQPMSSNTTRGFESDSDSVWEMNFLSSFLIRHSHGFPLPDREQIEEAEGHAPGPGTQILQMAQQFHSISDRMQQQLRRHPAYNPADEQYLDRQKTTLKFDFMNSMLHRAADRWATLQHTLGQSATSIRSLQSNFTLESLGPILRIGPVVVINVHEGRCDAIILRYFNGPVTELVPLETLSFDRVRGWAEDMQQGQLDLVNGIIALSTYEKRVLIPILRSLWKAAVNPILQHLSVSNSKWSGGRIWWYPTGPLTFLPLHAAGPYDKNQGEMDDSIISSYVPTIYSLIRAYYSKPAPYRMLAVGQPDTPNMEPLPCVTQEIETIRSQCDLGPGSLNTLMRENGTVYRVKQALSTNTWLHFSCHAYQDKDYPFRSAFFLHNGSLELSQIMQLDLSHAQFAYTPACESSKGDEKLPDESIHLASGLQFAGVRSVIATMWSVDDNTSVEATREIYKHLFRNRDPNPLDAAEALHTAMKAMKAAGIPLSCRVPFIHIGI